MTTRRMLLCLLTVVLMAGCATTPPPAAAPASSTRRFVIDPRTGYPDPAAALQKKFDRAWGEFLMADFPGAQKHFGSLAEANPGYGPARLALAAIAMEQGDLALASQLATEAGKPAAWYASREYVAEIALRAGRLAEAQAAFQPLATDPLATEAVRERAAEASRQLFDSLFAAASAETDAAKSIDLLRHALAVQDAPAARTLLVQKLIAAGSWDDARMQLEPLLQSDPRQRAVQQALADIDAGKGRYEEAISRYEKLSRQYPNEGYEARLADVKRHWAEENLPPQFHAAMSSGAITRADMAVLMFWKVSPVRFATSVPEPPIATDVENVAGREELVRVMALRFLAVDPITREVNPGVAVNGTAILRVAARLLAWGGASCSTVPPVVGESDAARAVRVLAACGVSTAGIEGDAPVSGASAGALFDAVDRALSSRK